MRFFDDVFNAAKGATETVAKGAKDLTQEAGRQAENAANGVAGLTQEAGQAISSLLPRENKTTPPNRIPGNRRREAMRKNGSFPEARREEETEQPPAGPAAPAKANQPAAPGRQPDTAARSAAPAKAARSAAPATKPVEKPPARSAATKPVEKPPARSAAQGTSPGQYFSKMFSCAANFPWYLKGHQADGKHGPDKTQRTATGLTGFSLDVYRALKNAPGKIMDSVGKVQVPDIKMPKKLNLPDFSASINFTMKGVSFKNPLSNIPSFSWPNVPKMSMPTKMPDMSGVIPSAPKMPKMPDMSGVIPSAPKMPKMPDMSGVIPSAPNMPKMPDMSGVSASLQGVTMPDVDVSGAARYGFRAAGAGFRAAAAALNNYETDGVNFPFGFGIGRK
jgi:hypothetical protein